MVRFVLSQLSSRPWRALALAAAIFVAAASFSVLTAAGQTTEIRVRGSVESNYRTAYDILVRPVGSQLPLERNQELVRNNYLSGLFGGIRVSQWQEIKEIPGVAVAAPVANIGFVIPHGNRTFPLKGVLTRNAVQLYRIRWTTIAHGGNSRYPVATDYVYYTRRGLFVRSSNESGVWELVGNGRKQVQVCPGGSSRGDDPFATFQVRDCYSARSPGLGSDAAAPGKLRISKGISFPILIAGIDPVEERKLLQLDTTVVAGRYLRPDEPPRLQRVWANSYHRLVPIIAATRTYVDEKLEARIERLTIPPGTNVPARLAPEQREQFLASLRGTEVARRVSSAQSVYELALAGTSGSGPRNISLSYWTADSVEYRRSRARSLQPRAVRNPLSVWKADSPPGVAVTYQDIPSANADIQFRRLHARIGSIYFDRFEVPGGEVLKTPVMEIVGRYDPEKLPGFSRLSEVPLETYYPPELLPADKASRRALGRTPLLPSQNIGDYVAQPPLFLTTLEGMRPFLNPKYYKGAKPGKPISVIRVRVKGVTGPDKLSQARIRQVAIEIHDRTGLQVDITAGSSPRRLQVALPEGRFGRPALLLQEGWSKKGVSLSFLQGLDRKRLALLSLILISCSLFLANGAFASVRGRRTEIGALRCFGWPNRAIFGVVLAELVLIGAVAGLAAAAIALGVAELASVDLSPTRALLAAPLAVALATVTGIVPAWRAVRVVPMEAVRPAVAAGSFRNRVRTLLALAMTNVRRMPARTLAGAAGLFLGSGALAFLIAINQAFQGRLVGTLLGEVVSAQVRGLDFLVVGVIVLLAGLSLADVLYLNLRERAAEFVTLKTVGWTDGQLGRVIATEAVALALVGAVPGAALGAALGLLLGAGFGWVLFGAVVSIVGSLVVALVASLVPLMRLASLTAPSVLAEE